MAGGFQFDFSEEELFRALSLALPESEARREARAVASALMPDIDWATSEETLLLLSLGTETGNAKVESLRRQEQAQRRIVWMRARRGATEVDLRREWDEIVTGEDQEWAARRDAMRQNLLQRPMDPPG
jgi:hypothetical protein